MNSSLPGGLNGRLQELLLLVERPSRYLGGEWNSPEVAPGGVSVALAYPDIYEIGSSNLGLAILQEVVNEIEGASAERVYSPWVDMEAGMRSSGLPLFTLETHRPVSSLDIFGISVPHELTYTNILNLIDLAGLPLASVDRRDGPIVIGGGCGTANPEPLAEFFDLFVLGDGEEVLTSIVLTVARAKEAGLPRSRVIEELALLQGVYRPADYEVIYNTDGTVGEVRRLDGSDRKPGKGLVDIDRWLYPRKPIVPFCEPVHDRLNVEVFRGCTRGCRFCLSGMTGRPVRERSAGEVVKLVDELSQITGHDEVSLCSLSSTDYSRIDDVASRVTKICRDRNMILSLPSLRMDAMSAGLAARLDKGGRGGLTFAPEAGTERLRAVINKPISEEDMAHAVLHAVRAGRRRIKLYFMIGLQTETDEDVLEISRLVYRLRDVVRRESLPPPSFNVSVSTFVPKPHTPFQWCAQESREGVRRKQDLLKSSLRSKSVNLSWHDRDMSAVEGFLARGDRRISSVIRRAWESGGRFDSWSEHFDISIWESAWEAAGLDPSLYLGRERGADEVFPWEHLDHGLDRDFLRRELERALAGELTSDCRGGDCSKCGVCTDFDTEPRLSGQWEGG